MAIKQHMQIQNHTTATAEHCAIGVAVAIGQQITIRRRTALEKLADELPGETMEVVESLTRRLAPQRLRLAFKARALVPCGKSVKQEGKLKDYSFLVFCTCILGGSASYFGLALGTSSLARQEWMVCCGFIGACFALWAFVYRHTHQAQCAASEAVSLTPKRNAASVLPPAWPASR